MGPGPGADRAGTVAGSQTVPDYWRALASSACSSLTVSAIAAPCLSTTGFIFSRNLASSAGASSLTCMPPFFDGVQRGAGLGAGLLALVGGGLHRGVRDDLLLVGRQRVPELLADQHRLRVVLVVGQRGVFLHFEELVRGDHGQRVFLAVDGFLLQRGIDLGEGQRRRVGAQRLDPVDVDRRWGSRAASGLRRLPPW